MLNYNNILNNDVSNFHVNAVFHVYFNQAYIYH